MSRERHVVSQLLVAVESKDPSVLDTAVAKVLSSDYAKTLGLSKRPRQFTDPPGVAILDSLRDLHFEHPYDHDHGCKPEAVHLDDLKGLGGEGAEVSANYIIVQMSHGRVLPLGFPRPGGPALEPIAKRFPNTGQNGHVSNNAIRVAVIDSPVLYGTSLDGVMGRAVNIERRTRLPVAVLHGTFTAGMVRQVEPRASVELVAMTDADSDGFYSDFELASQIMSLVRRDTPPHIISLSLGSVIDGGEPVALRAAVKEALAAGVKIFAAAGNDGDPDTIVYPAKFTGVHVVGAQAIDSGRPRAARFTNRSTKAPTFFWAAGVDVKSYGPGADRPITLSFRDSGHHDEHENEEAVEETLTQGEMLHVTFEGSACWSGCSVAVPIVAARCATFMIDHPDRDPIEYLKDLFGSEYNSASFSEESYGVERCGEKVAV